MNDLEHRLSKVFCQVFQRKDILLSPGLRAADVPGWDSLTHMELIAAIEQEFAFRFSYAEVMAFQTINDMLICIDKHLRA
jgi:acyl carrier protein